MQNRLSKNSFNSTDLHGWWDMQVSNVYQQLYQIGKVIPILEMCSSSHGDTTSRGQRSNKYVPILCLNTIDLLHTLHALKYAFSKCTNQSQGKNGMELCFGDISSLGKRQFLRLNSSFQGQE